MKQEQIKWFTAMITGSPLCVSVLLLMTVRDAGVSDTCSLTPGSAGHSPGRLASCSA